MEVIITTVMTASYKQQSFASFVSKFAYTTYVGRFYTVSYTKAPSAETISRRIPATVTRFGKSVRNGTATSTIAGINGFVCGRTNLAPIRKEGGTVSTTSVTPWCITAPILYRVQIVLRAKM